MRSLVGLMLLVAACAPGDDESEAPEDPPPASCAVGDVTLPDGGCVPPGVAPDDCAMGFEADGAQGCRAILPASACAPGQMALTGETTCRALGDCGQGDWGHIAVDAATEYVDGAFSGTSLGSAAQPWTTIGEAVAAAAPGAIVAVAAGSYSEDVDISGKAVRLWGRCAEMVEIVGSGNLAAVLVRTGGSEVRDLAVRGPAGGVVVVSGEDVFIENVWVHDTGWHGVHVESYMGPASATVRGTLIERAGAFGLYVFGASGRFEDGVVRDTQPDDASFFGYGIHVEDVSVASRGTLEVMHAVVERSTVIGIGSVGSDLSVSATLVRDTLPSALDGAEGRGINAEDNPFSGAPGSIAIDGSVVELSRDMGIFLAGVTASIRNTVVRDTLPEASSNEFGRALNAIADDDNGVPSHVTVQNALFERSHDAGIGVFGSLFEAAGVIVRATQLEAASQSYGYGIVLQDQLGVPASSAIHSSVVADNQLFGVAAIGSEVQLWNVRVERTATRPDGNFGDGIGAFRLGEVPANAGLTAVRIEGSGRAAVSAWGGSLSLLQTTLECNALDINTETFEGKPASVQDLGENVCGCQADPRTCKASSTALAPPEPLPTN